MNIIKSYTLYLNTKQATQGNANNCNFNINPVITLSNVNHRFAISCPMIELPYSFNQLNSSWNTLNYQYAGGTIYPLVFPEGNYNITNLISTLISLLISAFLTNHSIVLTTASFNITYNSNTGLITFSMSSAYSITLRFSENSVMATMFGASTSNITFSNSISVISPNKVQVNPVLSVYIRSGSIKFSYNSEAIASGYKTSSILAKIPVNLLPNSIIYNNQNTIPQIITNQTIDNINLYITDNLLDSQIDMKGINYGIMIRIDEVDTIDTLHGSDKAELAQLQAPEVETPQDKLLNDLINKKLLLENQIKTYKK